MKKIAIFAAALCVAMSSFAQKDVTLKAGTMIPVKSQQSVKAADVEIGQTINFLVARDVNVDGVTVIPYGSIAKGTVTQAKKSSWFGTRGRLGIDVKTVTLPDGTVLPLTSNGVQIKGANRTTLSVLLFLFVTIPAAFIPGGRAEMPANYEIECQLATTATVSAK